MEKSTPHCKLSVVKILIEAGKVRATASAFQGARELGINDLAGMCAVVMSLTVIDFYKSMTTHADYRIWQDVYRAKTASSADVYLKLTVIDDVLIGSFNLETAVGCARVCRDWRARQGATTPWAPAHKAERVAWSLASPSECGMARQARGNRVHSALTHQVNMIEAGKVNVQRSS